MKSSQKDQAREAELKGDLNPASKLYEESLDKTYPDPFPFERLIIIYRKLKRFKDELRVIKKGIDIFTRENERQLKEKISTKVKKNQLAKLSNAFLKTSGLIDKKGKATFYPEPINKWMKRKVLVEQKVKGK